jgi:hypothetical protein
MELVFTLPLILLPLLMPLLTGLMAQSFGRNFWTWFAISIPLPLVANLLLLRLPDLSLDEQVVRPVENHELFDHLFLPLIPDTEKTRVA